VSLFAVGWQVLTSRYACFLAPGTLSAELAYGAVGGMGLGLLVAAVGDAQKSKAKHDFATGMEGSSELVTSGLFKLLRHPNYTGEQVLWSFSALAGLMAALVGPASELLWSASAVLGALGINYVLTMATTNLEKKQEEKYGALPEYQAWVKSTFGGFHRHKPNEEEKGAPAQEEGAP